MKDINFFEHFYNSNGGDRLVKDVSREINPDIWEKRCLVFGYGEKFLDNFEAAEVYYAIPSGNKIYHWPKIRPFKTIVADADALPFSPEAFDAVVVVHYVEFEKKCSDVFREIYRVLKPKGKLIIVSANKTDFLEKNAKKLGMNDIISELNNMSFFVNKIFGVNRKMNFWPYRFSYTLNKYNEAIINVFPFMSDIVIISSEKTESAPEVVSSFSEQYEMS
ncbi:MAG: class I SAM-dependent methyltransferase [Alphaproteobacteria bacterium]|nr:class I SAM-dependent methyltransferase [Alphaproteobacteria bacterium]